jgi:hypothetical protein
VPDWTITPQYLTDTVRAAQDRLTDLAAQALTAANELARYLPPDNGDSLH